MIEAATNEIVKVYRAPTCSNCMRVVGYLRDRGVVFEDIDITSNDLALKELGALGVKSIPTVVKGGRYVSGRDLDKVEELLGLKKEGSALGSDELLRRAVRLLEAWSRFARQLPPARYGDVTPGMENVKSFTQPDGHVFVRSDGKPYIPHGTYYGLVGHILRHGRRLRLLIEEPASPIFTSPSLSAEYGEPLPEVGLEELLADGRSVVACVETWRVKIKGSALDEIVDTFGGPRTVYQMLARETYSLAQHTRQLMTLLLSLGIEPQGPIGAAEFDGLRLPENVWK